MPADQADFLTATKFINTLLGTGVTVHRATADFTVAGKKYPKGSYVVKSAQAFRPHVLDMFEPQDHPNDFAIPAAPPNRAVRRRRLDAGLPDGREVRPGPRRLRRPVRGDQGRRDRAAAGQSANATSAVGFFLDTRMNDSFRAVNRLAGRQARSAPLAEAVYS